MKRDNEWQPMTNPPAKNGEYEVCWARRYNLREYWEWYYVDLEYKNGNWYCVVDDFDEDIRVVDDEYTRKLAWRKIPHTTPPEFALEELQEMNRRVLT